MPTISADRRAQRERRLACVQIVSNPSEACASAPTGRSRREAGTGGDTFRFDRTGAGSGCITLAADHRSFAGSRSSEA